MRLAIIGGTGVYNTKMFSNPREVSVNTPYGQVNLNEASYKSSKIWFLTRHGQNHTLPPHKINYRANIWALWWLGVRRVIATAATGAINPELVPGTFVVPDDFLDFTKGRKSTFFDGDNSTVFHGDFTNPYCPQLRRSIIAAGDDLGVALHKSGTYVCTEGPRYESPAEIRAFSRLGGDIIGMTSLPEATLAREAGICYATLALVTNFASGLSPASLKHEEVVRETTANFDNMWLILKAAIDLLPDDRHCECGLSSGVFASMQTHIIRQDQEPAL